MRTRCFIFVLALAAAGGAQAELVETNVAQGKPTSGDVAFGNPTSNGNDGNLANFTHADNLNPAPLNPYWHVDLGGEFDLVRVEIVDRIGCCDPNRLNGSEIRVLDKDGVQIGATMLVDGLTPSSIDEAAATRTFNNGGAGFAKAAAIRVDGYTQYFQFSELRAISMQPKQPTNVAVFGVATASMPVYPGQTATNLIDGNPGTTGHPNSGAGGTLGFTFTVNLGSSFVLERIELQNRTNCCPERLTNYRVRLHERSGAGPGPAVWEADVRTDGTNSGDAGIDTLTADLDPDGIFTGQYITVENLSNEAYNPQIAELRAFSFRQPPVNLARGKPVVCYDSAGIPTATWTGFLPSLLVDGVLGSFSHPQLQASADFYYEIDLGADTAMGDIELTGRLDGCCPERFNNARLEIRNAASAVVLQQEITGQVIDTVKIAGNVTGRYVRIINADGAGYGPQVGEVAIYPPTAPPVTGPFFITGFTVNTTTGAGTVTFISEAGAEYTLEAGNDLTGWTTVETNIASDGTSTTEDFADAGVAAAKGRRYYRVKKIVEE